MALDLLPKGYRFTNQQGALSVRYSHHSGELNGDKSVKHRNQATDIEHDSK